MVDSIGQIGVLAHEGRLAILKSLAERPKTGAEVARELGRPANQVHYHLGQLLRQGLIVEVGKGRKRWKEERYYRTAAHHFIVDPRVGCHDLETSAFLTRSIESAFLDWRREELLKVDLAQVARRIVQESLRARPGDKILVIHGSHGLDLAELILVELQALRCRSHSRMWSYSTILGTLDRHSRDSLTDLDFVAPEADDGLDGVIFLASNLPEGGPPSPEQMAKLPLLLESVSRWHQSLLARGVRYVEFALPFRRVFAYGRITVEEGISIFWRCIQVDREQITRRAEVLRELMGSNPRLRFSCPRGTDLTLEVDLERSFVLDGQVSPEDAASGRVFEGLPAGTLNFFPVPGSAHGTFHGDYTFHGGLHVDDISLQLGSGRITDVQAPARAEVIQQRIERSAGDSNLLSGVRFGLNPAGRGPTGMPVLDACLAGTVTLHFGNNELQGGDVRSTFDLTLPACRVTVESGERRLVTAGVLAE
jgi:leucyl aminopeptidase (aminopeptidase T)